MGTILRTRWGLAVGVGVVVALSHVGVASAQGDLLPGWKVSRNRSLTVYTPTDLQPGEAFSLVAEPPAEIGGANLTDWLTARVDADVAKLGTVISRAEPTRLTKNGLDILTCAVTYRAKSSGKPYMVAFMATRRSDGQVRLSRMLSSGDKTTYSRYLPAATKAVFALAKSTGATASVASSSGATKKTKPPVRRGSDAYTRSGAGPKASAVYGVYSLMRMQSGVGGSFYMIHQPMILLQDGTFFEDFDVPLADFDVQAARTARPTAWGKWRKQGATFQALNSKGVWEKEEFYGPLPKAKPGEKLKGFYSTISGGGDTALGGTTMVVVTSDITFLPNGRFKAGRFAGGMTPNVTVQSESGTDGAYTLDGYTLTLKYRDGRVERKAFAFMDTDGTKDAFYSNGSPYLLKDKK